MGVVIQGSESGASDVAYIKGALEMVIKRCDTYLTADGREVILDQTRRQEAVAAAEAMASDGLRVLGFASGSVRESRRARLPAGAPKDEDMYQGLAFAGLWLLAHEVRIYYS